MARATKIEGLHLWEVKLANSCEDLWVTTRYNNLARATVKACNTLKKMQKRGVIPLNAVVKGVTSRGTLDA